MESSGLSNKSSDPTSHRWARIVGTAIALLTLVVPTFAIAYFSLSRSPESLPRTTYVPSNYVPATRVNRTN